MYMSVLVLSRYSRLGASSRLRALQYLPYLKRNGVKIKVCSLFDDAYLNQLYSGRKRNKSLVLSLYLKRIFRLISSFSFDLLWIEKELFPMLPAWAEQLLTFFNVPYVVDYDDAVFHNYDLNSNSFVRNLLGRKIDTVMKCSSLVIAGNGYLARRAIDAGAVNVKVMPTVIDLDRYSVLNRPDDSFFNIGWIGSPSTAKYLTIIESALSMICLDKTAILSLVGVTDVTLHDIPINKKMWSELTEVANIQSFDVGIMPLFNDPWAQGKCGYKLIQYMACGIPVIASPVGVNSEIVEHGVNGFIAANEREWYKALSLLRADAELRKKMGAAGRKKVKEKYCLQVTAPRLLSLLSQAVR